MSYQDFLTRVIDEGIEAAKTDYAGQKENDRLDGSIAGFEACRNKQPNELFEVFKEASEYMNKAFREQATNYWYFRCYQAEVEWVCNVVSALLYNEGQPAILSYLPTVNGMMKAASIVGVKTL